MKQFRLAHLSTVHPRDDIRVNYKQCRSLISHGYDVTYLVADGLGDQHDGRLKIMDVGCLPGRLNRIFKTSQYIFRKAVALDADVYHLHDPELISIGLKLKRLGKKVILDMHEDVPKQLLDRPYLGPLSGQALAIAVSIYERFTCRQFDGIIAATPVIRDKFLAINPLTIDVNNFPIVGELDAAVPWMEKRDEVCYVGGIAAIRGIREVVRACELLQTNARLNLVGNFTEPDLEAEVKTYQGWTKVIEHGVLDRVGVRNVLGRSVAGLVSFHPKLNHIDAQPNKMFEYMSSGIPVIGSNFPLWREIIEGNGCGLCIDPLDPKAIAEAIDHLVKDPALAQRMGDNGRQAVLNKYNWSMEERKLLDFYERIIADGRGRS